MTDPDHDASPTRATSSLWSSVQCTTHDLCHELRECEVSNATEETEEKEGEPVKGAGCPWHRFIAICHSVPHVIVPLFSDRLAFLLFLLCLSLASCGTWRCYVELCGLRSAATHTNQRQVAEERRKRRERLKRLFWRGPEKERSRPIFLSLGASFLSPMRQTKAQLASPALQRQQQPLSKAVGRG